MVCRDCECVVSSRSSRLIDRHVVVASVDVGVFIYNFPMPRDQPPLACCYGLGRSADSAAYSPNTYFV
jgi:hypothetical protein